VYSDFISGRWEEIEDRKGKEEAGKNLGPVAGLDAGFDGLDGLGGEGSEWDLALKRAGSIDDGKSISA
jgi:hypothetical protein